MPKAKIKTINTLNKDEAWLNKNFENLINEFPGQYVLICNGDPFIGYDVAELERKAKNKYPGMITTGMPIPRPEDFISVLVFSR